MSLPAWIENYHSQESGVQQVDRLYVALSIAWEALEKYKNGYDNPEHAEDAMRRIEELK